MRRRSSFRTVLIAATSLIAINNPLAGHAQNTQQIFTESLDANWQNWSWCATDFGSHEVAHSGVSSIKATITAPYQGLYLHCDPIPGYQYTSLTFWINGGKADGRSLCIAGIINDSPVGAIPLDSFIAGGGVAARQWRLVTVPLAALGLSSTSAMTGFWIADTGTKGQPAFYVDDIALNAKTASSGPVSIKVDVAANRHAINPQVYGTAFASQDILTDLNSTLNRQGGNAATRYNWQQNASNHANDWYFESMSEGSANAGDSVDSIIAPTLSAGAQAMITVPTLGWVAKLGANRSKLSSFSISKYGGQQSYDAWMQDAGNGVQSSGQSIKGNDPNDANVAVDSIFQQNWIKHITGLFGTAASGGVAYYLMDNEPSAWHTTHRDVHPVGAGMDEVKSKIIDYAAKIKAVDPSAQIVGPEEWGWTGYFYSGLDQWYGSKYSWRNMPDRANHANQDYIPWLLSALKAYDTNNQTKSLDVFSLHFYPQSGEFSDDTSADTQLLRNRSTRSLWDPNYTDASWINTQVQLIPRMKTWVSANYPGLKTAITEYNWGAESHINGATTQADILGIFGREGLDMATRWTTPDPSTPTYKAMKMYRNVDGSNNGFGDVSVSALAPDPDNLSSFAAVRSSDGTLTLMLINKALSGTAQTTVNLANFTPGNTAKSWQLTSANAITPLSDMNVNKPANASPYLTFSLPAQSVTLVMIPTVQSGSTSLASASFVGQDTTTQGNWIGKFGSDGYNIINYAVSNPAYAAVSSNGNATYTWATSTQYAPVLQKPALPTDRFAACWYSAANFTVDVNLTDGQTHQVSFYCLDYDQLNRSQSIDVLDAATGTVLSTQSVKGYQTGAYLIWNIKGHVVFRFNNMGGAALNAVLSGLFFDAPGSSTGSGASATFVKTDSSTSGSWKSVYGSAGYDIINYAASLPSYATIANSGTSTYTWTSSTAYIPALQKPTSSTDRYAACWYSADNFTVDMNLTDGQTHQVSLYSLDFDQLNRAQTIDVLDASTNAVLDTRPLSGYQNGTYLVWKIKGHVKFRLTNTAGPALNAVLTGLFFD